MHDAVNLLLLNPTPAPSLQAGSFAKTAHWAVSKR